MEEKLLASERMLESLKQEMTQETQNRKFALELEYQTKLANKEKDMQTTMAMNQSKDQEILLSQQTEIQQLRMELSKVKQARQVTLTNLQQQIVQLKQAQTDLVRAVEKDMTWKRVGPKHEMLTSLVE